MSHRQKYILVVHAAVVAMAAGFLIGRGTAPINLFYSAATLILLSATLVGAYNRFIRAPLRRVAAGAERLAAGDHAHRIVLNGEDDMAAVARAINRLADKVAEARVELEQQVAERTEDLRAVLEEVHERSRIAEEVNRRLEEADRRKTEFLTNVSHELRTPLTSIVGYIRLLQDEMIENDDERHEFYGNMRQSAEHLLHLVTDVLSVAQVEAGVLPVEKTTVHPGDVVCDVLRMMDPLAREKKLAMRFEVDGDVVVTADEPKLRQVLINLVGNAVNFTDVGSVTVRVHAAGGETVRFEVQDTGEGIPRDQLELIFEKFHQVDSRAARHSGGTGLGLSISRELVQRMGGTMGAQSDGPGRGSLVFFTLPAAVAEPTSNR